MNNARNRRFRGATGICPHRFQNICGSFLRFFAYRKRYSAIGKITLYRTDNIAYHIIAVIRIFSALQYKRSEAKLIACFTAIKYLLLAEPVALCLLVTAPYSAIITVVFTVVGKFYQTSDINVLAVVFSRTLPDSSKR